MAKKRRSDPDVNAETPLTPAPPGQETPIDAPVGPAAPPSPPSEDKPKQPKPAWVDLLSLDPENVDREQLQDIVARDMTANFGKDPLTQSFNIRLLIDSRMIGSPDSDQIYKSFKGVDRSRPILLIVKSGGGSISAAFFVAKVCRENTDAEFAVAVPREAKSAATLICCGADRIHMGSLSELGPIDPQFGAIPALALKHSVEHIAELAAQHPGATGMLTDYLERTLRIEAIGYYERVAASAVQYAVRLLKSRSGAQPPETDLEAIAQRLVYAYKDHGFVIDSREAAEIFGNDVIACNTPEYELANKIHTHVDFINIVMRQTVGREISFAGAMDKCSPYEIHRVPTDS